jgi:hypothetical protein
MIVLWLWSVIAIVLVVVGVAVKGLFYLFIVGVSILVANFFIGGIWRRRRRGPHSLR